MRGLLDRVFNHGNIHTTMTILGGELGYRILRWLAPAGKGAGLTRDPDYGGRSKVVAMLGEETVSQLRGKHVVDFGCGSGGDSVALALAGAERVLGVEIQERLLGEARARARAAGVEESVIFSSRLEEKAEAIISIDAFEHFADPAEILRTMATFLSPTGRVYVSFGPTWYHPLGGHLFSVFPWSHLLFSERALIRWRSDFKDDGASRFSEVAGGLNQMTIRRFQSLVRASPLEFERFEAVPIRSLRRLHRTVTREFTTAIVRATLRHRTPRE